MSNDLMLDTLIRDWVLIPLSVVMVLIGVLRHYVTKLLRSSQKPDVKEGQVVLRARYLRAAANLIPAKSFLARRVYYDNEVCELSHYFHSKLIVSVGAVDIFCSCLSHVVTECEPQLFTSRRFNLPEGRIKPPRSKENELLFVPKGEGNNMQAQMFTDPNMAMDMMKKNLSMIIPQPRFCFP